MHDRILRLPEVEARTGLRRSAIYRHIREIGDFPAPRKLTDKAVGWLESDINAWIESRQPAAESGKAA